jgi:predicted O-linked N-acetylglucosamine transferase (SPINDLY family)
MQAAQCFERVLALEPGAPGIAAQLLACRQQLCDWRALESLSRTVLEELKRGAPVPPMGLLALPEAGPNEQRLCARAWAARRLEAIARANPAPAYRARQGTKPRIGYLSADFHEHATAYLAAELFELHDRRRFETFAYSYGPDDSSPMRRRLVAAFDRFHDVQALSAEAIADRIRADGIDLLVDLKGYTGMARPEILAYRPAPVQAQFLGYPGTMGTRLVDYLIADRFVVPEEERDFYDEEIVYLPRCYQPNDRRRAVGPAPSRAGVGLPERGFVFCSFNQTYKLTPEVFDIWMRLLGAVQGSVLWLLESNPWAPANLRREAEARGVDARRLVFAPKLPLREHLGRLQLADLVLDNWPYNGHTTASDALWAGVPVLTLPGRTFASRVAGSLLGAMELPELIAANARDYGERATALATNLAALPALRSKVARQRDASPLFETSGFTRDLESAYEWMLRGPA